MKKNLLFKTFLVLIALLTSIPQMWADNEYNKRYLYVNSSNCSWWTDASSQPALNAYFNTNCNDDWAAFKELADGALSSTSWYFDLSDMNGSYLYFRGFKIERHPKNTGNYWNTVTLAAQNNGTNNCLWINSDGGGMTWGNYAATVSSISLAATDNILSGSGTSGSPYLVPVGKNVTLTATPTSTPADGTMSFCANFGASPSANPTTVRSSSTYTVNSTTKTELKCIGRNKYGDVYSADKTSNSVYVQGVEPSLGVSAAGSVTSSSAMLNATVTVNGATTTKYGFKYGTTNNVNTLKNSGTDASTSGALASNATSFSKGVTGLTASTTYYYISYVTTASGTYYSASTQSFTTSAAATYNLSVVAGTGISAVTGSTNNISASQNISITATVANGYTWSTWTKTGSGTLSTFTAKTKDQTVTVGTVGNMTLTASATEKKSTLTTANSYDGTSAGFSNPTMSVSSIGITTTATVTAASNDLGYTLTSWTITNGSRADNGGANANPITVRSDGSGNAVTVTANYVGSNRMQNIYLPNSGNSWSESDANWRFYKLPGESGNTAVLAVNINKNDYYGVGYKLGFNIYHSDWGTKWWHNSSSANTNMDAHNCTDWGFNTSAGDFHTKLDLNVSGTYTFTLTNCDNSGAQALTVTYPDKSFMEGNFPTAWDEDAYTLSEAGNVQSVTINITEAGDKEFRLVSHGKLFGTATTITKAANSQTLSEKNMADDGAVMTLAAYVTGNYTFSYNKSTKVLTVTYPVYNQVRIASASPADAGNVGNYDLSAPSSNVRSVTRSLKANTTYTFKVVYDSEWYGYNSGAFTRSTSTSSNSLATSTSGGDMTLTTDYAGNYTFKFNQSTKALSITYPTAYKVTYGKGTVNGSSSNCSAVDLDNSSSAVTSNSTWVKSGHKVKLTAPAAKQGYTYDGWFDNNSGTGTAITTAANCTITVSSALTRYACYHENNYTVTVNAGAHGSVAATSVTGHKDTQVTLPAPTADLGYYFTGWTTTVGSLSYDDQTSATAKVNGLTAAATVQANFASIWALYGSMNSWGTTALGNYSTEGGKTYGYVDVDLNANTQYSFKMKNVQTSANYKPTSSNTEITYANKATAQGMNNTASGDPNQTIMTAGKGTYRFTWNATDHSIKVTYPISYTVTFGYGTGGSAVTATVQDAAAITSGQYATSGKNVTFTQTPATGYTFKGWYTSASGGSAVSGMSKTDNVLDAIGANANVYAQYTANNYTVTFDLTNGGTCGTESQGVTFGSAYGALPTPTPPGEDSFIGWYTTASGSGELVTAATIVSTASNHRLYARYEHTYEVKVQYKCGSDVLSPQTRVDASASSVSPTVTAPEIFGYSFSGWTETGGSYVTFDNASAVSTTITTTGAATIVANYTAVPTVYFKNNLGWENVYVTFDAYFDGSRQNAPGNYDKPYFQMTQIGSSDIFYCAIPSQYSSTWAWNIAFDNTGFDASGNVGKKYGAFDSGEFIGRADFDQKATMFIPFDGDTETRNGGTFYNTGCWIQYNTNYSGYKVRVNSNVQGGGGTETVAELRSTIAGSTEFTATVNLTSANYKYGVMLYKDHQTNTNDIWFTNVNDNDHVITSATTSLPWAFYKCTDSWQRCQVQTEALGDYKFTVSFATGKPMVDIEYPVSVGDWKLIYTDADTWSNDAMHPSRVIKANANAIDTVSFFVSKATGANAAVELHKCTAINPSTGAETWTKQSNVSLTSITATGIYNFKITQNGSKVASAAYDGVYSGNFYIRTDASDGGWSNYKMSGKNLMTYSEYAQEKYDYTHYFMRFAEKGVNIKFIIANDYNECLSDTLISDTYTNEWIEAYANVRFMWDKRTNKVGRAYISGSSIVSDRFLVLEGSSMMYDENGKALTTAGGGKISGLNDNEMKFTDDQNWIYEATIMAKPGAKALLTAKYNGKVQYFGGSGPLVTDSVMLINGSGTDKYKVRVVYDFKTNRLIKAFIPEGAITTNLAIQTDLMIIRDHQADAKQITFSGSGRLSEVKTVYGAMMFNKWTVNDKLRESGHGNAGLSRYERDLFYISFPFDVKLSEVFGFGTYGKHWIIEYYDGKGRAKNGFWADSDPNWKFVMPKERNSFTMKAFEGYILALDLDELTESSEVWYNGVENVYIYFPSSALVENIASTSRSVTIDQTGYQCTINRPTPDGDRRVKDSYWHCIGVPSFANYSSALYDTNGGTLINWSDTKSDGDNDQWTSPNLPYLYEVNWSDKSLSVTSSATFSFKATWSYLVQYEKSTIYWANVNVTPAGIAARHRANWKSNYEFRLELQKDNEKVDQTYVSLRDDEAVTNNFDFNFDLSKEMNASRANIYTMVEGYIQTAGNCLPLETEQVTTVPVGVVAKTDGSYTFAMPDGTEGLNVMLYDNQANKYIDLSIEDYTLDLTAGTYDNRFYLTIDPRNSASTIDVVSGEGEDVEAAKIFSNGLLYIQRGDKLYDARGARVK